jgi:hypothetical protein
MNKTLFFAILFIAVLISCESPNSKRIDTSNKVVKLSDRHFVLPELPETIKFCGNVIDLTDFDVKERLDKEIIINTYYHSSTIFGIKRANRYFPIIEELLAENNAPDDLKYLCLIESNLTQAVSPSGAKGFWQFMPKTAVDFGLTVNSEIDERLSVEKSTAAACQYLKKANSIFNDWMLTAASYNMGIEGVRSRLAEQKVSSYFDLHLNSETSRYVFRILALKIIMENPEAYGFYPKEMELYPNIKVKNITITESIPDLRIWAKNQGTNYHKIKVLNPWLISNKLTRSKVDYIIQLPK